MGRNSRRLLLVLGLLALLGGFQNCSTDGSNTMSLQSVQSSKFSDPQLISSITSPQVYSGGSAVIAVNLASPATAQLTFQYQTVNSSAIAGVDFTQTSSTLSFPVGQQTAQITIPTIFTTNSSLISFSVEIGQLDISSPNFVTSTVSISPLALVSLYILSNDTTGKHVTDYNQSITGFSYVEQLISIYSASSSANMVELYLCVKTINAVSIYFSSTDFGCEGPQNTNSGKMGYIDLVQNTGEIPLYRWYNPTTLDFWDSTNASAGPAAGYTQNKLIGYGQKF